MVTNLIDFAGDRRFPWFIPFHFLWPKKKGKKSVPVKVALTFDIEENYPDKSLDNLKPFLKDMAGFLKTRRITATFFVQGSILPVVQTEVAGLSANRHLVGLHGYHHDNWGNRVWFWDSPPLSFRQKTQDLKLALANFQKAGLPAPVVFRAPNMNSNRDSFRILRNNSFLIDSSWPSFRRPGNKIFPVDGLWEVPLSSLASPRIKWVKHFPFADFTFLNLANVVDYLPSQGAKSYVNSLIGWTNNHDPFLVFLAHPWEFFPNRRFSYCSKENWKKFEEFLTVLSVNFKAEYVALTDLIPYGQLA